MENLFESIYVNKELLSVVFEPVCSKYQITLTETIILLCLSKYRDQNTAKDIVNKLKIAKSHISTSIHNLESCGYIEGTYDEQNRRLIHLHLCEKANEVIADAEECHRNLVSIILNDFTEEEIEYFKSCIHKIVRNANNHFKQLEKH